MLCTVLHLHRTYRLDAKFASYRAWYLLFSQSSSLGGRYSAKRSICLQIEAWYL